ncbi:MAG: NAD(P)-dependent oxidoreductase [Chloroflexi bacterium]|nr:NAD(P)-dependent oxidoreductase [Chloroflexota bacterium]
MAKQPDRTGDVDIDRKSRLRIPRQVVHKQKPQERVYNFNEVYLGFTEETAKIEASRCLQCPDASGCSLACPLHNDIPRAMWHISRGEFLEAAKVYRETSNLPEVCGRVCPQEKLCQGSCVVGKRDQPVFLGKLEYFVSDYERRTVGMSKPTIAPSTGKRVAVVGSGPAGIAVAEELIKRGHAVTVFEILPKAGGVMVYGIPSFKLKKSVIADKIQYLEEIGVKFVMNTTIGKDKTIDDLMAQDGFDAVFLGTGAWTPTKLNLPGEDLKGIYMATEYLIRGNLDPEYLPEGFKTKPEAGHHIAILGGGDTAMDCVRTSRRLQIQSGITDGTVTDYYRRSEKEMPGKPEERTNATEEGITFEFLVAPVQFMGDENGHVQKMELVRMTLGEPDASGRRRPIEQKGSNFVVEADTVICALGYNQDRLLEKTTPDLKVDKWGCFIVDKATGATSKRGVYAGGDAVTGADLVVTAMAAGRRAAVAMDTYLRS